MYNQLIPKNKVSLNRKMKKMIYQIQMEYIKMMIQLLKYNRKIFKNNDFIIFNFLIYRYTFYKYKFKYG